MHINSNHHINKHNHNNEDGAQKAVNQFGIKVIQQNY